MDYSIVVMSRSTRVRLPQYKFQLPLEKPKAQKIARNTALVKVITGMLTSRNRAYFPLWGHLRDFGQRDLGKPHYRVWEYIGTFGMCL